MSLPRSMAKGSTCALKHLGTMRNLESLNVRAGKLDDESLKVLAGMTKLRHLVLTANCDIDDEGLAALKDMTELRTLDISSNRRLTGAGFRHLGKRPNPET